MKTMRLTLFLLFTLVSVTGVYAQNLKPDLGTSVVVNVPPVRTDYIGLSRIYVVPNFEEDQRYRSYLINQINPNVYTIESSTATADMYMVYDTRRWWRKNTVASSTTSTSKDKQGNVVTTTTYRYDGEEEINLTLQLFLTNGTLVGSYSERKRVSYVGTSTGSYQMALNDYNSYRDRKNIETLENLLLTTYDRLSNEYLFTSRTAFLYAIGVKSRKMDYSDMNMAADYMMKWFSSSPTDLSGSDVVEANKLYDMALIEYEPGKKSRIDNEMAAVIYYEKACMEFLLNNYRKAEEYILKSEELDPRIHHSQESMKNLLALLKERKVFN